MTRRRADDGPHPVDRHVGRRVKQRRTLLGLSQQALGAQIGLSFQQVQKYESGSNRIGASRLYEIAGVLGVPVGFFFEGLPPHPGMAPASETRLDPLMGCGSGGLDPESETLKLVGAYYRIRRPALRKKLLALIRDLGSRDTGGLWVSPL